MTPNAEKKLKERIGVQVRRMKQAERDRPTLLGQTVYVGTLGLLLVVPVVIAAYLGGASTEVLSGFGEAVLEAGAALDAPERPR